MRKRAVIVGTAVAVVALALFLLYTPGQEGVREARADCERADCRPELGSLVTLDGERLTEADLEGKIVMVNFWATWCAPCVREMPALQAVYERHGEEGFVILGILADARSSDEAARQFVRRHGVTYPIVRSTPELERLFGRIQVLPTSFLYDRDGYLRAMWKSAIPEEILESEVGGLFATGQ